MDSVRGALRGPTGDFDAEGAQSPFENPRPARTRRLIAFRRLIADAGPSYLVEVAIFLGILLAFQSLGYGGRSVSVLDAVPLGTVLVALSVAAAEARFQLHRRVWSVAGIDDVISANLLVVEATVLIFLANALMPGGLRPLRLMVPVLAAPALALGLSCFRLLPRLISSAPATGNRLLVVVSDPTAYMTVKLLVQHPNPKWSPAAIVTEAHSELRKTVMGVPVVGHVEDLPDLIQRTQADGVALVVADEARMSSLLPACLDAQIPIFIVPPVDEWLHKPTRNPLRQLSADDLVSGNRRELEVEVAMAAVEGRCVLVTGAAGSIGAELCRLLARMKPRRLVIVDNNESGLFDIADELRVDRTLEVVEVLASIVDRDMLMNAFIEHGPQVVFHAAAYKHVPMLEAHPHQAVLTNVVGTRNVLVCAEAVGVEAFVLISTDKAVARHSVMGCTKRMCELLVLGWSGDMRCWAVRFGNVVGSRGSVVPIFERQIQQGGPITITHPDVSRYMMTIREAASLVISTLRFSKPGHLYMLDMGEPIKIERLAEALVRSRGLRPGLDIEVVYTGLRPGERLTEELLAPEEGWRPTEHPSIREIVSPHLGPQEGLEWVVERLSQLAANGRSDELVRVLKSAVTPHTQAATEPDKSSLPQSPRSNPGSIRRGV